MTWEIRLLFIVVLLTTYTWAGYPALLWLLRAVFARQTMRQTTQPTISVIVPVHNEQAHIAAKLEDLLRLEYPRDRLEIIVASDGSTDATEEIVRQLATRDSRIRLIRSTGRAGKSGVQNLAAQEARGEFLFLTDANTRTPPPVLQQLVRNFADPRVGLVSATIHFGPGVDAVSKGQSFYWRYECFLRQAEADLGILATAGGPAMMIRNELYSPIPPQYGDDCILPLQVRLRGYLVLNDADAVVFDTSPHSIAGELRCRIRMTARNWSGTLSQPAVFNPLRFPMTALGLVSHKLLRWLTPFFLLVLFALNTRLVLQYRQIWLWTIQFVFYVFALVGWWCVHRERHAGVFGYAFSFCLANVGFFLGLAKAVRGRPIVTY